MRKASCCNKFPVLLLYTAILSNSRRLRYFSSPPSNVSPFAFYLFVKPTTLGVPPLSYINCRALYNILPYDPSLYPRIDSPPPHLLDLDKGTRKCFWESLAFLFRIIFMRTRLLPVVVVAWPTFYYPFSSIYLPALISWDWLPWKKPIQGRGT